MSSSDETQRIDLIQETKGNLNAGKVVFSRFELQRELGSGGMGVVWLAKDLEVEGRVALKFLPGLVRDPIAERDLRDEVKNARDLVHENIVSVRTLHKDDASIAVEMEYVDGPNIRMLVRDAANRFLEVDKAGPIVRGLCLAIDHAWTPPRRLVHRDIKPANLLVTSAGQVKVVDFGIAHTVSETITRLTGQSQSSRVVGTLPYMSPQQLKGEVHHANDVYSIGATIFDMLTGTPPFRSSDAAVLTQQINNEPPGSMSERRKQLALEAGRPFTGAQPIPKVWEEVIASCLAKDPSRRPQTARAIAVRLGLADQGMPAAGGAKKSKTVPIAIAAGVVLAAAAGGWFALNRSPGTQAPVPPVAQTIPTKIDPPVAAKTLDVAVASSSGRDEAAKTEKAVIAPPAPVPRQSWELIAVGPVRVNVTRESDAGVEFDGALESGEKHTLSVVDKTLLIQLREGKGFAIEVPGNRVNAPAATYGRWLVTVPSSPEALPTIAIAPLPFDTEVGPLAKMGTINQLETDWLRAALGGEKGDAERLLVRQLFTKDGPITVGQWRARTALKFKPDAAALTASDPELRARAVDFVLLPGGAEVRLLRIEPGTFQRGSPADEIGRRASDSPLGSAKIAKAYFLGIFEVTQAQYESVMKRSPSYWRGNPTWPVDQVTWSDLMGSTGFVPRLNADLAKMFDGVLVADLPTDDEWEFACRAGTTTALNSGQNIKNQENDDSLKNIAHYNKAQGGPRPVGSFDPNTWGFYDMHGNLQEWTQDRYVRGGSWQSKAAAVRSAARVQMSREAGMSNQTGFRLALRFKEQK